ncbi:Uncharacterized protein TCM_015348 [Theobroma cacao]|uniref:Uncharacterized protein n=1 Tax=Theobroma cacao TaxID=3641 RepID=A0A061G8T3_THECC|nr:Uncharacterized protein TCM_015348 [Theobroma cacao]
MVTRYQVFQLSRGPGAQKKKNQVSGSWSHVVATRRRPGGGTGPGGPRVGTETEDESKKCGSQPTRFYRSRKKMSKSFVI